MRASIVSVIVSITIWCFLCGSLSCVHGKSTRHSAAVPKGKSSKSPLKAIFGNSLVRGLMRDAKMTFSSPLELITLQLTRPSNTVVPLSQLDELATFVELEGDNPEALVGGLAKLSRKFAEPNIFSQLKTIASLHYVLRHVGEKMSVEWARAILSMMKEKDEKTNALFFDMDSLANTKSEVESSLELEVTALTELYIEYFMNLLKRKIPLTTKQVLDSKAVYSTVKQLMNLLTEGNQVYDMAKKLDNSSLISQLAEFIELDFAWIGQQLAQFYENHTFDKEFQKNIEDILVKLKVPFVPNDSMSDETDSDEKETKKEIYTTKTEKEIYNMGDSRRNSPDSKSVDVLSRIKSDVEKSVGLSSYNPKEDVPKDGNREDNENWTVENSGEFKMGSGVVENKDANTKKGLVAEEYQQSTATGGAPVVKKVKKMKPKPRPSSPVTNTDDHPAQSFDENKKTSIAISHNFSIE